MIRKRNSRLFEINMKLQLSHQIVFKSRNQSDPHCYVEESIESFLHLLLWMMFRVVPLLGQRREEKNVFMRMQCGQASWRERKISRRMNGNKNRKMKTSLKREHTTK